MAFFTGIKDSLFSRDLRRKVRSPQAATNRKPVHLDTARTITLLFQADSAEDRKLIDRWRDARNGAKCKVRVIGYFAQEVGAASFDFSVVTVKDIKFSGAPGGPVVQELQKEQTELLIRLGPPSHDILDYLAATTEADLKVGPYTETTSNPYHLLFDAEQTPSVKQQLARIADIFSFTNASK